MNAHTPLDPAAVAAANAIMDRLRPLAVTLANARAYRAHLEDLRDRGVVEGQHADAIRVVRSALLRSAIGTIMAALDKRGDARASVGQVIHMLERTELSLLASRWPGPTFGATELQEAKHEWEALTKTDEFRDCKDFRDATVAHTLMWAFPSVPNEAYFRLHDAAERLAVKFYAVCGYGVPEFREHQATLTANAKLFWDTHWRGMGR